MDQVITELPITHNLVSHFILIGLVQSFFIGVIFFIKARRGSQLLLLWGLVVFCSGLTTLDLYLCYTGLMQYSLHFNDSTEFITLLLAPFLYLASRRMLVKHNLQWSDIWPHFFAPLLYFLNMFFFWRQPWAAKYNSYIDAYFPDVTQLEDTLIGHQDPFGIKGLIDWWILASFLIYLILALKLIADRKKFTDDIRTFRYGKQGLLLNTLIWSVLFIITFIIVESYNDRDAGDYIIGIVNTITSFALSYFVISSSQMLDPQWLADKYDTAGISNAESLLLKDRLINYLQSERFARSPGDNQSSIATVLNTPKSYLSRVISHTRFDNYNDLVNHYRIRLAKIALKKPSNQGYTIEAIGKQVGFGSKSSFYKAFKKEVGMTPAAFANKQSSGTSTQGV